MSSNISVKITADVVDLQAKFAIARAQSAALTTEFNKLARTAASSGMTDQLKGQLTGAAEASLNARGRVAELGNQLRKLGVDASSSHGALTTATREFRALFDELSSGRTRMVPGTLAILATRVFGIGGAALASIAGVLAFAAAIAALAYNAVKASEAVSKIKLSADFAGDVELTRSQIQGLVNELADLPGVSRTDAQKAVSAFSEIGVRGKDALTGLSEAASRLSIVTSSTLPEAAKKLSSILDETHTSAANLAKVFPGITAAESQNFIAVQRLGDANKTTAALIKLVAERTSEAGTDWAQGAHGIGRLASNFEIYLGVLQGVRSYEEGHQAVLRTNIQLWNDQTVAMIAAARALSAVPNVESQLGKAMAMAAESSHASITNLRSDIALLKSELSAAPSGQRADFLSAIQDKQRELQSLTNKSTFGGTGFSNAGQQAIDQAKEAISQINAEQTVGDAERLAQIKQTYADLLSSGKLNAAQILQVERDKNEAIASAQKQAATEGRQIDQSAAQTSVELAQMALAQKRSILEQEVADGKISKQSELAQLMEFARQEGQIQLEALAQAQVGYAQDSAFFQEKENEKKVIAQRVADEIASYQRQAAQDSANFVASQWKRAFGEINSAEQTFISAIWSRQSSVLGALEASFGNFVEKEIEQDAKGLTARLVLSKTELAQNKELGQMGVLWEAVFQGQKTSAVLQGATTRAAASTAAASAGSAAQTAVGSASILNDAYQAAAGAYAATSQIPVVGPILAPAAAGAAFAAVAAFDKLKSFDVGTNYVPSNMLAVVHEGERIIPKADNADLMDAVRGGGAAGAGMPPISLGGVNALDARSFLNFVNNPIVMRTLATRLSAALTNNPSWRPSY